MSGCFLGFSLALALFAAGRVASGRDANAWVVERLPGAEECPGTDELHRLVEEVRGAADQPSPPYRVRFERNARAYEARIFGATDASERKLTDEGATCVALGRATAVTLALLIDSEPAPPVDAEPSAVFPRREPERAAERSHVAAERTSKSDRPALMVHAGGAVLAGAVRPLALGPTLGLGFRSPAFSVGLAGLWMVPEGIELGPGKVTTSFVGGALETCLTAARASFVRFDSCSGFVAGRVRAEAHGYTRDFARSRPWLALPLGLVVRSQTAPLSWDAGLSVLAPLRRQDFEVEGVGVAYRSTPVATLLSLRAVGVF